jgi:choline-glycine betaine transporter
MQQRPTGVAVLAVVAAVLGVLAILGAGAWWNASEGLAWLPRIHGSHRLIVLVLLVVGISELVLANGTWMLRQGAWRLGVALRPPRLSSRWFS